MNQEPTEELNVDKLRYQLGEMKHLLAQNLLELDKSNEERRKKTCSPLITGNFLTKTDGIVKFDLLEEICTNSLLMSDTFGKYSKHAYPRGQGVLKNFPIMWIGTEMRTWSEMVYCQVFREISEEYQKVFGCVGNVVEFFVSKGWYMFVHSYGGHGRSYYTPAILAEHLLEETKLERVQGNGNKRKRNRVPYRKKMFKIRMEREFQEAYLKDSVDNVNWNVKQEICEDALHRSRLLGQGCAKNSFSFNEEKLRKYPFEFVNSDVKGEADFLLCNVKCKFSEERIFGSDDSKRISFLLSKGFFIFMNAKERYELPFGHPVHIVDRL